MTHRHGKFTSRTKARKRAADILFEADQKGIVNRREKLLELLEERKGLTAASSPLPEYAATLVAGVASDFAQIQHLLENRAKGSGLDRIPPVDLAVMRVAIWEMLRNKEDVPPVAAIDEAVIIVKDLSTDDSPGYVNAVLDAIRKDLENPWSRAAETVMNEPTVAPPRKASIPDGEFVQVNDDLVDDELEELLGEY